MGEKKKDKKKEKEKDKPKEEEAAPAPAAPPKKKESKKKSSKKKASKRGSGVFSLFSEEQLHEFKKGFDFMDSNKDGMLDENDLRKAYDAAGVLADDKLLDGLMSDAPQPLTFTAFLTMFAERMASGGDEPDSDARIIWAFTRFDPDKTGGISPEKITELLLDWGEPFSPKEYKEIMSQLARMEEGDHPDWISVAGIIKMLTGTEVEEEEAATASASEG